MIEDIRKKGGIPYIVSAMGSHGNGTEEGQREVLASYGITEENLGVEIVTTVDVNHLGRTPSGKDVYFDRAAMEADAVIPINRVKSHNGLCRRFAERSLQDAGNRSGEPDRMFPPSMRRIPMNLPQL